MRLLWRYFTGTPSASSGGGSAGTATGLSHGDHAHPAGSDVGFANPMTTAADLIVGGTAGAAARLAKGSDGQVLTVDPVTHLLAWATPAVGVLASLLDAKGDLIAASADNTPARVAVGSNLQTIEADSSQAAGIKWASPHGVIATLSGNQAITTATFTNLLFGAEESDSDGYHSTSSATDRLTIPTGLGGLYLVTLCIEWDSDNSGTTRIARISRNGSGVIALDRRAVQFSQGVCLQRVITLAAADYLTADVYHDRGSNLNVIAATDTCFSAVLLR